MESVAVDFPLEMARLLNVTQAQNGALAAPNGEFVAFQQSIVNVLVVLISGYKQNLIYRVQDYKRNLIYRGHSYLGLLKEENFSLWWVFSCHS